MTVQVHFFSEKPENYSKLFNLSVSKIKTFEHCKTKYRFNYIERLPKKEYDFHIFGKFLHQVLELFHLAIIKGDTRKLHLIMEESFKKSYQDWAAKLTPEQKTQAYNILVNYLNKVVSSTSQILAVERQFYLTIDDKLLLNGFIDRTQLDADGVVHVSDYKTSKTTKYLEKDYFQLLTYALVLCIENPDLDKIRTSYIMLKHGSETLEKTFTRDEVLQSLDKLIASGEAMQSEQLFLPSAGPLCEYCDFQANCQEGQDFMKRYKPQKSVIGFVDW